MSRSRSRDVPRRLVQAGQRFDRWRQSRQRGARIPDSLWALAVKLAEAYGVSVTAKSLRLSYYTLKERLEEATRTSSSRSSRNPSPEFVELPPPSWPTTSECVVELEDTEGAKMRIHLKGASPDLIALSHSFWNIER